LTMLVFSFSKAMLLLSKSSSRVLVTLLLFFQAEGWKLLLFLRVFGFCILHFLFPNPAKIFMNCTFI
jgi:hypothetical protein